MGQSNNEVKPAEAEKSQDGYGCLRPGLWIVGVALFCSLAVLAGAFAYEFQNINTRGHSFWKSAKGSMRTLNASQALFIKRSATQRYGSLDELGADGYIDDVLRAGTKMGYSFEVAHRSVNGTHQYWVKASPVNPPRVDGRLFFLDQRGERYFFTNELGVIYQSYSDFEPGFFEAGKWPPALHRLDGL